MNQSNHFLSTLGTCRLSHLSLVALVAWRTCRLSLDDYMSFTMSSVGSKRVRVEETNLSKRARKQDDTNLHRLERTSGEGSRKRGPSDLMKISELTSA